jgi:hypothetical protein
VDNIAAKRINHELKHQYYQVVIAKWLTCCTWKVWKGREFAPGHHSKLFFVQCV